MFVRLRSIRQPRFALIIFSSTAEGLRSRKHYNTPSCSTQIPQTFVILERSEGPLHFAYNDHAVSLQLKSNYYNCAFIP